MRIRFLNHASFIVTHGGASVLNDPWLSGSAFNNGWDLICESPFGPADLEAIDYIFFSHEHPDHFAPSFVKSIPEHLRTKIIVLFQKSRDQKVAEFCRRAGFEVLELGNHRDYTLRGGLEVRCGQVPFFDSWILYRAEGQSVLNLNDCVVRSPSEARALARRTGPVDALLTQFSYAAWKGNVDDRQVRLAAARAKLDAIAVQIAELKPRFTIPFASYVYFSHVENRYNNDGVNTPRQAAATIAAAGSAPVVLYPGSEWDVGSDRDSEPDLKKYDQAYAGLAEREYHTSPTVPWEELQVAAREYAARIKRKNNRLLLTIVRLLPGLGFLAPLAIRIKDLNRSARFSLQQGLEELPDDAPTHVTMHSDSLNYVLKFEWGYDTLTVNGRFEADERGFGRMTKLFALGPLNNIGKSVGFRLLFDFGTIALFLRALRKFMSSLANNSSRPGKG